MRGITMTRLIAFSALAFLGCDSDDPFTPSVDNVAGTYTATTFTTTAAGVTTDHLAAGASVELTLSADGSTSGRLFVPDAGEEGGDFEANLVGSWTIDDQSVVLDHDADTFLRDVTFTAARNRLTAERTFVTTTVRVVLNR
jgi:hypothetical protein